MPVVDLFCGCGGLSKGFELAGFDIIAGYDGWQSAVNCYNQNFEHEAHRFDLNNVEEAIREIGLHDPSIIIGGPPCQEFSNAGRRQEGDLADLTYKFAQIIAGVAPEFFVMENVPRARESVAFSRARELYRQHNYGLTEVVLDASYFGVPQSRKRFFCIGALGRSDDFLLDALFSACSDEIVTVREYFEENNIPLNIDAYYRHPTTYSRRAIFSVDEIAPTIRGVNRPRPATYRHHPNDAVEAEAVAGVNRLTLATRALIQTFPVDFAFDNLGVAQCELEQMVGNAVPVLLAQTVAMTLHNYIDGENVVMDDRQSFAIWLREQRHYTDRSISDVFSRLNRAAAILPGHEMNIYYIVDLENVPAYQQLSTSVKSQIRKAINLKLAYLRTLDNQ